MLQATMSSRDLAQAMPQATISSRDLAQALPQATMSSRDLVQALLQATMCRLTTSLKILDRIRLFHHNLHKTLPRWTQKWMIKSKKLSKILSNSISIYKNHSLTLKKTKKITTKLVLIKSVILAHICQNKPTKIQAAIIAWIPLFLKIKNVFPCTKRRLQQTSFIFRRTKKPIHTATAILPTISQTP